MDVKQYIKIVSLETLPYIFCAHQKLFFFSVDPEVIIYEVKLGDIGKASLRMYKFSFSKTALVVKTKRIPVELELKMM
jgi:hypothetical protein